MSTARQDDHDVDVAVIGSGFGGSVSALRLSEKGYRVTVLETGRRFADHELPKSTWDVKRYFFAPRLGLRGILRMTHFRDVVVMSGAGVGGGSLGYANTLYRAPQAFFDDRQWAGLSPDWRAELAPFYDEAERMLGVTDVTTDDPVDGLLRSFGEHLGVADTYAKTRVGVYFGDGPGVKDADPYFDGEGPERTGCALCARCMAGCPTGAKNTLVKNYLYLAERAGARVEPDTEVIDILPLGPGDGTAGYRVTVRPTGSFGKRRARTFTAGRVVVAAGSVGTNRLLARCKLNGSLPRISDRLGELVRTNSESIMAVTLPEELPGMNERVAISGSIYPDANTHIETVSYGGAGGAMRFNATLLVGDGTRLTRPLKLLGQIARHPRRLGGTLFNRNWSRRSFILLVMQSLDNSIALRARRLPGGGVRLRTEQDPEHPNPTFIPVANQAAEWIAEQTGGIAQSAIMESLANIPSTAHFLGGAVIGADASSGVIDSEHRVFGYDNLMVVDGSAVPANVGVNPSLTITALAERAMDRIPPKGMEDFAAPAQAPVPASA